MAAPPITERHKHHFHRQSPIKESVRAATTASITISTALNNGDSLDGVTLATGDRVLVKDQGTGSQNGIYVVGATPVRDYDVSTDDPAFGFLVYVREGTANGGTVFKNTNTASPTIGSTALTFAAISSGGSGGGVYGANWFNVEDYGAVHDAAGADPTSIAAATDDTAAIQAAIDACMTAGGGTVYFPKGVYAIKGAMQDTSVRNAQLVIPQNAVSGVAPPQVIEFRGEGPVGQWNHGTQGPWRPGVAGSVLVSDWAGTISGEPAVIAAAKYDAIYPAASFNWLEVSFRDLEVRVPHDPKLTGLSFYGVASLSCEWVTVCINASSDDMTVATHSNAKGIVMPATTNANQPCRLDSVFVDGFYIGYVISEVAYGGTIAANHCVIGQQFQGGTPHANHFTRILNVACLTSLKFVGAYAFVTISHLDIEHSGSGKFTRVHDVDDPSNYARGVIFWHTVLAGSGVDGDLDVNGGTGLILPCISDGTGWPGGGSGAPTTADYLVGTSNGSLSAEIVVGTSPGGELGGTWASPTVDATHAGSTHIALSSSTPLVESGSGSAGSGTTASKADHVHPAASGGGTGGQLLISDTPSGPPLVFADLIQNEAGTDLVYADS